ncbi:glycogen/starch synthase [Thermophagus xiamenensis]|jgi:starch synthase|uniref:starch synthase n=1 Tax=Thermophagus xiamenensis TaxID=385682 RepID=A0A1I1XCD8_9BACT|nr:glycogen/starch synthase [Thermophagus xiamenensis]SFE03030.1 starch synthase [Thermophagus xiamenensis]
MENNKVLFISQEITPYLPENPKSLLCRKLPQGIQEKGKQIRTFMPRFGNINERRNQLHEVIRLSGMNLIIDDTDHPLIIKVASIQAARMQVYFIDNEDYFSRKFTIADDNGKEFEDNDERIIFFARGVLETTKKLRWAPDVVHCLGWFTALAPLYIKKAMNDDPYFADSKVVYSVFDDEFTVDLNDGIRDKAKIEGINDDDLKVLNPANHINLTKLAIDNSDGIIQGSEKINSEIEKYIKESGKPFLEYQPEEKYIDAYNEFYDSL